MSESFDEISRLGRQLDKAIQILGISSYLCPSEYDLYDSSLCPPHLDCKRCWDEALSNIE